MLFLVFCSKSHPSLPQITGVKELELNITMFNKLDMVNLAAACQLKLKWDLTDIDAMPDFLKVDGDPLGAPFFSTVCQSWMDDLKSGAPRRHHLYEGLTGPPLEEIVFGFRVAILSCIRCFFIHFLISSLSCQMRSYWACSDVDNM